MTFKPAAGSASKSDNNTIALLSLYLLLLAFFILLNSISQREQSRTEAAIGSLDATFASKRPMTFEIVPQSQDTGSKARPDGFQIRLLQLFQTELPLARYEVVERGSVMRIYVPTDNLFVRDGADLRPSRMSVLDGIAAALQSDHETIRREVEFMISSGTVPIDEETALGSMRVSRSGAFARALIARGVPDNWVRTGLLPGNKDQVRLTFFVRDKDRALIDFSTLGQEE